MRTTLAIEDSILAEAKRVAQHRGITLGELVTDTLRAALRDLTAEPAPASYRVAPWGKRGAVAADPAEIAAMLAEDDQLVKKLAVMNSTALKKAGR